MAPPEGIDAVVNEALALYSDFLALTHQPIKKSVKAYSAEEASWREKSYALGESLSKLIDLLGSQSPEASRLRRLITI